MRCKQCRFALVCFSGKLVGLQCPRCRRMLVLEPDATHPLNERRYVFYCERPSNVAIEPESVCTLCLKKTGTVVGDIYLYTILEKEEGDEM